MSLDHSHSIINSNSNLLKYEANKSLPNIKYRHASRQKKSLLKSLRFFAINAPPTFRHLSPRAFLEMLNASWQGGYQNISIVAQQISNDDVLRTIDWVFNGTAMNGIAEQHDKTDQTVSLIPRLSSCEKADATSSAASSISLSVVKRPTLKRIDDLASSSVRPIPRRT